MISEGQEVHMRFTIPAAALTVLMMAAPPALTPVTAQAKAPAAKNWTPPRTPWGHPDLQGTYTNKDESGIPMEKPDNLTAKVPDQVEDSEFADIVRERNKQTAARAPQAGGITGAGRTHWYENYDARHRRLWL